MTPLILPDTEINCKRSFAYWHVALKEVLSMPVLVGQSVEEVELLQHALAGAGVGVWEYDAATERAKADARTAEMFDLSDAERHAAPLHRFLDVIHPEDVDRVTKAIVPNQPFDVSYRIKRNGPNQWVRSVGRWGARANATLLLGVTMDITEERSRQERLELLAQEMRHRVGNTFAVLGGLVSMESQEATTADDLADRLRDRLVNLSRAQSLTLRDGWIAPERSVSGLIKAVAKPFLSQTKGRFEMDGPDVLVDEDASAILSMVLYEWLTNALKYGAFSNAAGRIAVQWRVDRIGLALDWEEITESVAAPTNGGGFGEQMQIAALAPIGGVVERNWSDTGLKLHLRMPLANVTANA